MFVTIENAKLVLITRNESRHEFELSDVEGPAKCLCANPDEANYILTSSSVDFPQEEGGAPENFVFETHWDAIVEKAQALFSA